MTEGCPTTFQTYQNPNSVVGAINSLMIRLPHMPLGIDSVVGVGIYRTE